MKKPEDITGLDSTYSIRVKEGNDPDNDWFFNARFGPPYPPLTVSGRLELLAIIDRIDEQSFAAKLKGSIHRIWNRIWSSSCGLKIMSVSGLMRRFVSKQ